MIVKNEELVLGRCLESVKGLFNEIIIVDTGSSDRTKQIAENYGAKVYDFEWKDDFASARNFSFSKANSEYIMWLDADDVICPKSKKNLIKLFESDSFSADVFFIKYIVGFDENGNESFSYYRERILRKCSLCRWVGEVHETIATFGEVKYLSEIEVEHHKVKKENSKRNLKIYNKIKKRRALSERELYYYARELYYNKYYYSALKAFTKFIKMNNVWVEDLSGAFEIMALCYFNLNKIKDAKKILFYAFDHSCLKISHLALLGDCYYLEKKYKSAIIFYRCCFEKKEDFSGAFLNHEYYFRYPALRLVECYYYLNDYKEAERFNNSVLEVYHNDRNAIHNKKILEKLTNLL